MFIVYFYRKHFLAEDLCFCDHSTARKLFIVTLKKKINEEEQFTARVTETSVGFKMYARQHFVNSIYSVSVYAGLFSLLSVAHLLITMIYLLLQNYASTYELTEKEKGSVRDKLKKSAFAQHYSETLRQALTYHNWKNTGI